ERGNGCDHGANHGAQQEPPYKSRVEQFIAGAVQPNPIRMPEPIPSPSTEPMGSASSTRRTTHGDGVGAMSVLVLGPCHALCGAPRPTQDVHRACGLTPRWRGLRPISVEPVAPPRRKWHVRHERPKTTKGRHMTRELVAGAKAPAFTLQRDGG